MSSLYVSDNIHMDDSFVEDESQVVDHSHQRSPSFHSTSSNVSTASSTTLDTPSSTSSTSSAHLQEVDSLPPLANDHSTLHHTAPIEAELWDDDFLSRGRHRSQAVSTLSQPTNQSNRAEDNVPSTIQEHYHDATVSDSEVETEHDKPQSNSFSNSHNAAIAIPSATAIPTSTSTSLSSSHPTTSSSLSKSSTSGPAMTPMSSSPPTSGPAGFVRVGNNYYPPLKGQSVSRSAHAPATLHMYTAKYGQGGSYDAEKEREREREREERERKKQQEKLHQKVMTDLKEQQHRQSILIQQEQIQQTKIQLQQTIPSMDSTTAPTALTDHQKTTDEQASNAFPPVPPRTHQRHRHSLPGSSIGSRHGSRHNSVTQREPFVGTNTNYSNHSNTNTTPLRYETVPYDPYYSQPNVQYYDPYAQQPHYYSSFPPMYPPSYGPMHPQGYSSPPFTYASVPSTTENQPASQQQTSPFAITLAEGTTLDPTVHLVATFYLLVYFTLHLYTSTMAALIVPLILYYVFTQLKSDMAKKEVNSISISPGSSLKDSTSDQSASSYTTSSTHEVSN